MSGIDTTGDVGFLREAAQYFSLRDTHGEDSAHWSNVFNSENCTKAADIIEAQAAEIARLTARAEKAEAERDEAVGKWHRDAGQAAPRDGTPVVIRQITTVRYKPYKPDGRRQMKADGRWQEAGSYGGFENCDPIGDVEWMLAEDYAAGRAALSGKEGGDG